MPALPTTLADPWLLAAGPAAALALWLLERLRRRPALLVVADASLFVAGPEVEAAARARRRRLGLRWLLLALAALLLALAAAGPAAAPGAGGPLLVDLVLDAGVTSGARDGEGAARLDRHRAALEAVLDRLRADDRARVHVVPGPPGTTALAPAAARALLRAAAPTAAPADLEAVVARLAPAVVAAAAGPAPAAAGEPGDAGPGRPPVVVATDRAVEVAPGAAAGVVVVVAGAPAANRGVVGLARDDEAAGPPGDGAGGALLATVAAAGAPGPARVELAARGPDGVERSVVREVTLPARGAARVAWTPAEGLPAGAVEARARLLDPDALPADDAAFAALAPPRRRVGLAGARSPALRRALEAVPGTTVVDLAPAAAEDPAAAAGLDLLVVERLPLALPRVAVAVVAPALPREGARAGGVVAGRAHPAFRYTLAEVARAPFAVEALAAAPDGLADAAPLLVAGAAPLVLARGAGRELVLAVACPPERAPGWTASEAFPLLWAEALALAAPRAGGRLAAHPCGAPWTPPRGGPAETPRRVERRLDPRDGRALLGTVAAPAEGVDAPPPVRPVGEDDLARLEAARRPAPVVPRPAAPALLALALALAAWRAGRE